MRMGRALRNVATGGTVGVGAGAVGGAMSEENTTMGGAMQGAALGMAGGFLGGRMSRAMNMRKANKFSQMGMSGEQAFTEASRAYSTSEGLFGRFRRGAAVNRMTNAMDQVRTGRTMSRYHRMAANSGRGGFGMAAGVGGVAAGGMTYAVLRSNGGSGGRRGPSLDERLEYDTKKAEMLARVDIAKSRAKAQIWQNR